MMKTFLAAMLFIAYFTVVPSCQKGIWWSNTLDNLYSSWPVHDSIEMDFVDSGGVASRNGMYPVQTGGYVDFSTKGRIVFNINGSEHIDVYDATKYNLLKDSTPVNEGALMVQHVSISVTGRNNFKLTEIKDGFGLHLKTIYRLSK